MDAKERESLIDQYEDGFQAIAAALEGITTAELEAREAPGEWSPREIIHHLADSEMNAAFRVRQLIAQDAPTLIGYDQEAFVRRLYADRPIEPSLAAFQAARAATAPLLRRLSEDEWRRTGTHTEVGPYSVEDWLRSYGPHAHDHADQIRRARATAGDGTKGVKGDKGEETANQQVGRREPTTRSQQPTANRQWPRADSR